MSDFAGRRTASTGGQTAASNGHVHDELLAHDCRSVQARSSRPDASSRA